MIIQEEINREKFINQLPNKPYCSNDLQTGLRIRNRQKAIEMLYIQANQPAMHTCLLFDLDQKNSFYQFEQASLPVPHFITKSPESGRCHYGYMLAKPVCKTENGRKEPLRYLAAIESSMAAALKADPGYVGLITKNPLNPAWSPWWSGAGLYEMDYLADFIEPKQQVKFKPVGLGRNVCLFDDLRAYAYQAILKFKRTGTVDKWIDHLFNQAIINNNLLNPTNGLPISEVKATAKSVAKWTWRNFSEEKFSEIQSFRAKKPRKPSKLSAKFEIEEILKSKGIL